MTAYIGEPESSALVFINKFFVIIAKKMQNSGLQIMDMDGVFVNIIT